MTLRLNELMQVILSVLNKSLLSLFSPVATFCPSPTHLPISPSFCTGLPPSLSPQTRLSLKFFSPHSHVLSAKAFASCFPALFSSCFLSLISGLYSLYAFDSSSFLIICALQFPYISVGPGPSNLILMNMMKMMGYHFQASVKKTVASI